MNFNKKSKNLCNFAEKKAKMATATFKDIKKQLAAGTPAPIYVLHGEEGYYLDELVKDFESMVPESERDFNLYVLYAPQVNTAQVLDACMRYPMMAERQVVILKEAQKQGNFLNTLSGYATHPNPQTVFVVVSRGEQITGAKFLKAVGASNGVVFESKKLRESNVGPTITTLVTEAGLSIDSKAREMLVDHIGTDLTRIHNEIDKLRLVLPKGGAITPQIIEKLIGISKDFNNFELVDALIERDRRKAYRIVDYFRSNPNSNPAIPCGALIFNFFAKLLMAQYASGRDINSLAAATGLYPSSNELTRIMRAMKNYHAGHTVNAISACRRFDTRAKGIDSRTDEYDLLRELVFSILN